MKQKSTLRQRDEIRLSQNETNLSKCDTVFSGSLKI